MDEIKELLKASAKKRLAALRNQRDTIRQRAAETTGIVHAINREITMETGSGNEPPDRLGRAQALVGEYRERSKTEGVPQQSPLLAEALDVLRPLTTGTSMDAAAVRLAVWIHTCAMTMPIWPMCAEGFLDQGPEWEDRAFATLELVSALTFLERHEEGVDVHRAHIEAVMANRPPAEWADAMWNSSHCHCWHAAGQREAWLALFHALDAGVEATAENREDRYELLHTAVMTMGTDYETCADEIDVLTQRMAAIIDEDPDWSERLWAEQRFEQQKVGNAVRRAMRTA